MILPAAGSVFYFVLLRGGPVARVVYVGVKLFTLVWPLLALRLILRRPWPRLGLREPALVRSLPLGLLTGLAIGGVMLVGMATPVGSVIESGAAAIRAKASALGVLGWYWAFSLVLSLFHSLLEEYYWRWFVFGKLREVVSLPLAHLLAAASFAAHHVVVMSQYFGWPWALVLGFFVGVGGALWSGLYQRQGTLAGVWLSHLIVDLFIMAIGYRLIFG